MVLLLLLFLELVADDGVVPALHAIEGPLRAGPKFLGPQCETKCRALNILLHNNNQQFLDEKLSMTWLDNEKN